MDAKPPLALVAADVASRTGTLYPAPFRQRVAGRAKRALGDAFGLKNFGVNLTELAPGAESALMHRHVRQDEFVYVVEGEIVLVTDEGEATLTAGMCAGFPAGGRAHHLVNRSDRPASYLEIGDRTPGDGAHYPNDDLAAEFTQTGPRFTRKDGSDY